MIENCNFKRSVCIIYEKYEIIGIDLAKMYNTCQIEILLKEIKEDPDK